MAAKRKQKPAYNPLFDGVDAAAEVRARRNLRKKTGPYKGGSNSQAALATTTASTPATTTDSAGNHSASPGAKVSGIAVAAEPCEPVSTITPPGRTYALTGPAAVIVEQMYVARDLRSFTIAAPAGMLPAEMTSRLDAMDAADTKVTRLTPEIWQSIEQQCRKMYDDAGNSGKWSDDKTRERMLLMLARYAAVREWARRQGWLAE